MPTTKEAEDEQLQIALLASANIGNRAPSPPTQPTIAHYHPQTQPPPPPPLPPTMMTGAVNHHFFGGNVPFLYPYYVDPQVQYPAQRHWFQESAVPSNASFYDTQTSFYPANMTAESSISKQHSSSTVTLNQAIGYNSVDKVDEEENITVTEDKGITGDGANVLLQFSSFIGNHDLSNA